MAKIALGCRREISQPDCLKALVVEFIATFLFIFVGVGSAITADTLVGNPMVALFAVAAAHTLVVAAMVSASFHISGGHLNPAVTLGLAVGGHITLLRSALYWIVQLLASSAACSSLRYATGLATPVHRPGNGISSSQGVAMEVVLTFALVFTVYGTIVDRNKATPNGMGPILVGLMVGANILAGGSFSGASMNPARSFGPALVMGAWSDHWVYWVGPLFGSVIAGFLYEKLFTVRECVQQQRRQTGEEEDVLVHY